MNMKLCVYLFCASCVTSLPAAALAQHKVADSQSEWFQKYKNQKNAPQPAEMLLNTDPEPTLSNKSVQLFNGKDLNGWSPKGGTCEFDVQDGCIVGTCVPGSNSTYLCTDDNSFTDFLLTCEMKWEQDCNSGVMFRAQVKGSGTEETVFGPQAEMEGFRQDRGWSGGIYGQSCGGYFYPVWLEEHEAARKALKENDWNRITVSAKGNVVKTWVNGTPVAHWLDNGSYPKGFFGLQIHKGKAGKVWFRSLRVERE